MPLPAGAQTASGSAQETGTSSAQFTSTSLNGTGPVISVSSDSPTATQSSSSPFDDSFLNSSVVPKTGFTGPDVSSLLPNLDTSNPQPIANFVPNKNTKWTISPNTKHDFRSDEQYQVNVDNISSQNLNIEVFDSNGNQIPVDSQNLSTTNGTSIQVLPPKNFRPGKYTLKITDQNGNIQTQDFTWGVLAINTDKSIYLPNETANLAMAVLDDTGNMVCNAGVTLTITNPSNQTTILSTSDNSIIINPQCRLHNFSLTPDYEAHYQVSGVGTYSMTLTASTQNGPKTITDSFQVQNSVPFDVTRQTGTRIYPPDTYPVNLSIKMNQNFKGQIIDYVPNSFVILPSSSSATPAFDVKQIATPVKSANGIFSSIHLLLPFSGTYTETLGFGDKLLDPQEKDLYAQFGLAGHDGLDFAMPTGTPVVAADDGTVVMAGGVIYGTTVVIQHSWGRSYYGHLSKVEVTLGQTITKGQEIGLSGNTGITTGPHLHFSIKLNSNNPSNGFYGKTDPSPFLGLTPQQNTKLNLNDTTKAIIWDVDAKQGDTLNFSYNFKMPNVSPYFYTIGPLSFIQNNQVLFQEVRQWQLAADAATVIIITTAYTDVCGANCWTVPADFNNSSYSIEAIGGGGGGGAGTNGASANNGGRGGGGGGGGGEYRKITNPTFTYTSGTSVFFSIGTGGPGTTNANGTAGNPTTWNATDLVADGGGGGGWSNGTGGGTAGTLGSGGTGATGHNGGGGGAGGARNANTGGGGGGAGGAGGTTAVGGTASTGGVPTGTAGGVGGATSGGGSGTANGGMGGNGTIWTDTTTSATGGAGGGGGGGNGGATGVNGVAGGPGGNYGAGGAGGGGGGRSGLGAAGGNGINGIIVITYTSVANTTEFGYRWRNDDGNETTGTSLAVEDTAITGMTINTNYRLRFLIYNSGGSNASAQTFRLDYAPLSGTCAGSTYAAVPTTAGSEFITHSTTNYTDGTSSTNVSAEPAVIIDPSGGSFIAGKLLSTSNLTASITLNSKQFTEIEYNFQATLTAAAGGTYCFRVSNAGTALNAYSQYARVTIFQVGPTLDQLLRHGEWFNSSGVRQSFTF